VPQSSVHFAIIAKPENNLVVDNLFNQGWNARPQTYTNIEFKAKADANCSPGDSTAGYEIGIVQILTKEVNNAYYQGKTPADGSVKIRRDTPAVLPGIPCLDSPWKGRGPAFWSAVKSPITCGEKVSLSYWDFPQDSYPTIVQNSKMRKKNYLKELHVASDFITAFVLKNPDNSLQILQWAGWSLSWNYTFNTPVSGQSQILKGIALVTTIEFTNPAPAAPPELPTHYAVPSTHCNKLLRDAGNNPASIEESNKW
jgi:hypothetical protein